MNASKTRHETFRSCSYRHEPFVPPVVIGASVLSNWGAGDHFTRVDRPNFSVSFLTAGEGAFEQQGRRGRVETGKVFCAQIHQSQTLWTGAGGVLHKRSLIFEGAELERTHASLGLHDIDVVVPRNPRRLLHLFRTVHALLATRPSRETIVTLSSLGMEILLHLGAGSANARSPLLQHAVDFVHARLHDSITVAEIAAAVNLSVRHCTRLFRREMGCSPLAFYLQEKMALAESMVTNTMLSFKEIAASLGYDDPLYFSLQFKRHFGSSPRAWRNRQVRGDECS